MSNHKNTDIEIDPELMDHLADARRELMNKAIDFTRSYDRFRNGRQLAAQIDKRMAEMAKAAKDFIRADDMIRNYVEDAEKVRKLAATLSTDSEKPVKILKNDSPEVANAN